MPSSSSMRVHRTDRALSSASVRVAAEEGWGAFTFARVAERAGTSRRPLQDRYSGRSQLAAATWRQSVEPPLRGELLEALAAAGLLDQGADRERFAGILDVFAHPTPELQAAVELLIVAQFDGDLADAVASTLGALIRDWCAPREGVLTPQVGAQRAFLLSVALGLVVVARQPGIDRVDVDHVADVLLGALGSPTAPRELPEAQALHIDGPVPFETGDPVRDRLLQATLDEVGARGYEGATVEGIATRAASSQGALFARYASKLALFLDAARRQGAHGLRANEDWMARIEERFGRGIAEAAMIREFQRPGRHHLRVVALEVMRMGWHEPAVRDAAAREYEAFVSERIATKPGFNFAEAHAGFAIGEGTLLLSILWPDAWLLPYDVVTVPWEG